jgi:hypothetical protein
MSLGSSFEFAFSPSWSLGVEYRFSKFDRENVGLGTILVAAPGTFAPLVANASLETHEVTARLNWRFGSIFGFAQGTRCVGIPPPAGARSRVWRGMW